MPWIKQNINIGVCRPIIIYIKALRLLKSSLMAYNTFYYIPGGSPLTALSDQSKSSRVWSDTQNGGVGYPTRPRKFLSQYLDAAERSCSMYTLKDDKITCAYQKQCVKNTSADTSPSTSRKMFPSHHAWHVPARNNVRKTFQLIHITKNVPQSPFVACGHELWVSHIYLTHRGN